MQNMSTMERIRADLLRRARMERQGDDIQLEDAQSTCQNATQEADDSQASRRPFISRLFNRRPRGQDEEAGGGAKTADSLFRSFYFPSRNHRPNPPDSNPTPGGPSTPAQTVDSIPSQSNESSLPATPAPVAIATWRTISQSNGRRSRRTPLDPAEVLLAEFAADVRERRRARQQGTSRRKHPRRFLCCFPWIKSRRIRAQILRCFVSGLFLVLLLCIYLLLSMTKNINSSEMTIMLILVIIFGTVFFCHGLIRLVLLCMKGDREQVARPRACRAHASRGYAVPSRPIPVVLARDEEACGVESEASKMEPPAYGMWRESVRVDPNRLFWQRNTAAEPMPTLREVRSGPRPPSYISEDGVSYVVEAVPRSTAPTTDVPLPPHPSEVGRTARAPSM